MPFEFIPTKIPDVIKVIPQCFSDDRGFFLENYKKSDFLAAGITDEFVQDNHSLSSKGVLRGLHIQRSPMAQGKLVRCTQGSIWDVVVDVRYDSPTLGKWVAHELTSENKIMLYIPEGFAHGFCALSETAEICYKCSAEYSPEHDGGIIWNDSEISVKWPICDPLLSAKDLQLPSFKAYLEGRY